MTNLNYDAILNKPTLTSQWTTSGANISYVTGNVGIGIAAGGYKLTLGGGMMLNATNPTIQWYDTVTGNVCIVLSSTAASQYPSTLIGDYH